MVEREFRAVIDIKAITMRRDANLHGDSRWFAAE